MDQTKEIEKILGTDKYSEFFIGLTKHFNVPIHFDLKKEEIDRAALADVVYATRFTSPGRLAFAYFHELGHKHIEHPYLNYPFDTLAREIACWSKGLELASKVGIIFDDDTIQYGFQLAFSYNGFDEREFKNWKDFSTDYTEKPYL